MDYSKRHCGTMKTPEWIQRLKSDVLNEPPKGYYSAEEIAQLIDTNVTTLRHKLTADFKAGKLKRVKVNQGGHSVLFYGQ